MSVEYAAFLAGLLIFLGLHSVRIVAPAWREAQIARLGEKAWKLSYTAVSLLSFGLLLWGFAKVRYTAPQLFTPEPDLAHALRYAAALLMMPAFWLITAYHLPRSHFKVKLGHPMLLATKTWALAHLLVNHRPADLILFGGFLLWAVADFRSARRRPSPPPPAPSWVQTGLALVLGTAFYGVFAHWIHKAWIGVSPLLH